MKDKKILGEIVLAMICVLIIAICIIIQVVIENDNKKLEKEIQNMKH